MPVKTTPFGPVTARASVSTVSVDGLVVGTVKRFKSKWPGCWVVKYDWEGGGSKGSIRVGDVAPILTVDNNKATAALRLAVASVVRHGVDVTPKLTWRYDKPWHW